MSVEDSNDVAVLIPVYKPILSATEQFSIENTIAVLQHRDIYFIAPVKLAGWLKEYVPGLKTPGINTIFFADKFFSSIESYNRLLMSSAFYKAFTRYKFILIAQTDALVFADRLNEWMEMQYSYVGAPWFYGMDKPKKPLRFLGVGNGGLSLRRVDDFIRVLSRPRYIPNDHPGLEKGSDNCAVRALKCIFHNLLFSYNVAPLFPRVYEDMFWGLLVPNKCEFFKVPKPEEAMFFSFEAEPAYLYELTNHQLPFGCHAWERYDHPFWENILQTFDNPGGIAAE